MKNENQSNQAAVTLSFSDGRAHLSDLAAINETLHEVGVHVSRVAIPDGMRDTLKASEKNSLNMEQTLQVLSGFELTRNDVLEQVRLAGRIPVLSEGGAMSTGDVGVAPYPKVYDLKASDLEGRIASRNKFARLHVNSTDEGVGVDEVMTLASGGPFTWYFMLKDRTVAKLGFDRLLGNGEGFRLSYPGLTPHGGLMTAEDGIVIAYITGPKTWTMRYDANVDGAELLGTNPWVDFSKA